MGAEVVALDHRRRPGAPASGWRVSSGPVPDAYRLHGALSRDCGCGASAGQACVTPLGTLRRIPCVARLRAAAEASSPAPSSATVTVLEPNNVEGAK